MDFEALELVVRLKDERAAFVEALSDPSEGRGREVGHHRVSEDS